MKVIQKDGVFFLDKEDGERIRIGGFLQARSLQSELGKNIDIYIYETMKDLAPEDDDDDDFDEDDDDDENITKNYNVDEVEDDDDLDDDDDDDDYFDDDDE